MLLPNAVEDKPEFPSATLAIAVDSISRDHVAGAGISSIGFFLLGAAHGRTSRTVHRLSTEMGRASLRGRYQSPFEISLAAVRLPFKKARAYFSKILGKIRRKNTANVHQIGARHSVRDHLVRIHCLGRLACLPTVGRTSFGSPGGRLSQRR